MATRRNAKAWPVYSWEWTRRPDSTAADSSDIATITDNNVNPFKTQTRPRMWITAALTGIGRRFRALPVIGAIRRWLRLPDKLWLPISVLQRLDCFRLKITIPRKRRVCVVQGRFVCTELLKSWCKRKSIASEPFISSFMEMDRRRLNVSLQPKLDSMQWIWHCTAICWWKCNAKEH